MKLTFPCFRRCIRLAAPGAVVVVVVVVVVDVVVVVWAFRIG